MTGCKGISDITAPKPVEALVAAVDISIDQVTLPEGATTAIQVTARDPNAAVIANPTIFWSSSDTTVATVSSAGLVTARQIGTATVAASVGGRSAIVRITVAARPVASVQVSPPTPAVLVGGTVQLTARTVDDAGNALLGRPVFWSTNAPAIAVVDGTGRVTGLGQGVATVTATAESRSAAVGITVTPVPVARVQLTPARDSIVIGQSIQLTAIAFDSIGGRLDGRTFSWTSSGATIGTVSSTGLVVGVTPGTITVTATVEGRASSATIVVQPRPVGAVIVSPTSSVITVGQSVQLVTQITDGNGNLLSGRTLSFSSSNVNVATVSAAGVVTATAPGSVTITVTSEGRSGAATVNVLASPIATLRITPPTVALTVGGTARLIAEALDANGALLPARAITWTSGAPRVASVSSTGTVTSLTAGTALIFATAEGRLATSTITVSNPTVTTFTVTPASPSIIIGQATDLTATLRDPNGVVIPGRTISWSSAAPSVAIVSSTGRVRGVSPGTARIDASADGLLASATVRVAPVPVARVSVTLAASSLLVGVNTQATAVARDSVDNILTGRQVIWSSTAPNVATISAGGVITAVGVGVTSIRATVEGVEASAPLSVIVGQPTTLEAVTNPLINSPAGSAVAEPPAVRVTDAGGTPVAGVPVRFAIAAGGGTTVPASPALINTNGQGVAALTTWTLGSTAGANVLTATVGNLTGSPLTFVAQGTVGTPAAINAVSLTTQSTVVGTTVSAPPSVRVTDANGNPVAGVIVVFTVTTGGGTIAPASPAEVVTGTNGLATLTNWSLGTTAGLNTVTAVVSGLVGSPVTFRATGVIGAASRLVMVRQPAGASSGSDFATQPVVEIRDANDNVVTSSAATVTVGIATGTGALSGTTTVNAVNGVVTFSNLAIAGGGAHTLTFSATGLTSVNSASFSVTQVATSLALQAQPTAAVSGSALSPQPVVRILDQAGLPVSTGSGATLSVTAAIASGTGGSLSGTVSVAAVNGVASFTDLTLAGSGNYTLRFATAAPALTVTSAAITVGVGAPTTLVANAVTSQSAPAASVVPAPPSVRVTDATGNPVSGVNVTFTITSGGGFTQPASPATVATNAGGIATLTSWTLGATAGLNTITATAASVAGSSPITFSATGTVTAATQLTLGTQPNGAVSGVDLATQPVVQVRDASGNLVTGSSAPIIATITSGNGTLAGTTTVNAVSGIATFTTLRINGSGAHTLTFTSTGLTPVASSVVTVTQTPASVSVQTQPAGATSGTAFTTQPVVRILDNAGLPVTSGSGATLVVTAARATGTGTLGGTLTATAVGGVATFSDLLITGSGAHTLQFSTTSPALTTTSSSFTVTSAGATKLAIATQPSGAVSGVNLTTQPVVQVQDAGSVVVSSSTASVTATITSGTGTLVGTTTVSAVNGVATFTNLRLNGSGAHTITFTSTGLTAAASNVVAVTQVAASLGVQTQPAGATSGAAFTTQPVVSILDNAGLPVTSGSGATLVVTAARATGTGTLGGTLTATASGGVATFTDLEITGSGAHTLRFSTTSPALTVNSSGFTVTSAGATKLAIATQPSGAVSGVNLTTQPVVQVQDADNAVVGSSTASVTAAITSGTGTLVGTTTVSAVNGVATFSNLRLNGSGAHTITFTSTGLTAAASNPLTVTQVAASLGVQTQPAGATSGAAFTTQPVVRILDNAGLPVTSGTGATLLVTAARATGTGTLGGTLTATASGGVATFTDLEITGSGAHTLRFSTTSPALTTNSSSFTVTSAGATQLAISTQPAGAVSGVNLSTQPVVEIRDAANAVVSSSTASVTAAITSGTGTLVGTTTVTAANGVATFTNLRVNGSGAHTLTFTSTGLTAAASNVVAVTQVAASLGVQTQPAGATSGTAFTTQPVVQILDNAGLPVTSGSGATLVVTAARATGTGTLGGTLTATASGGVATFTDLEITGSGAHTLRFSTTSPALTTNSSSFTVTSAGATQLAISTQPAGAVSGVNLSTQPVVEIRDAANAVVTSSTASVTAAITSGTGTLVGTTTVSAANGVATFTNLRINGSGAHTITFTSTGLTAATSNPLTVTQVAASLGVQTQPAGATSGTAFTTQPVVQILDNAGLPVTSGTGATLVVTAARATGTGTLGGTLTATAVNGVATFTDLDITGSGAHTLRFSTTSPALTTNSSSFTVTSVGATQLAISTQPSGAVSGVNLTTQPVVQIRDAANAVVTSSTASVTAAITSGTGTLVGTATVTAVNGVATFTNLRINGSGAHTITFTSTGLTAAASNAVVVTQVAASLGVQTQPAGATSGTAFTTQPVVQILDNAGLPVTSGTGATLLVTAARATGTGTLGGTLTATAVNGVATFTDLEISGSGAHTLRFSTTSPALTTNSSSFTVTSAGATQLAISTQPAGAVSGVNLSTQPVVEIRDAANAVVTSSTASVTAAITSGTGTLVGTTTVSAANGVATFTNLRINGSGAHTITFTSTGLTAATSNPLTVTQVAASLGVQTQPAGATSGTAFTTQPVVQILDNAGLPVTSGTGATLVVTAARATGTGTLGGTLTATAVNGVATFTDLDITGSGAHTLRFSTTSPALTTNSSSFTVTSVGATQLAISTQPSGAVSGVNLTTQPVVQIRDAANAVVTSSTASVTAAITSGTGTLVGTATVTAVNGVATFTNLRINGSGAHTITFTSTGLTAAASNAVVVTQVAASLGVQTQPAGATSGTAFTTQPVVQILDNAGLPVTSGTGATLLVTAARATGTGTLGGTLTATAVNGVATFTDLEISGSGAHTLRFSTTSPALTTNSSSFTVTSVGATQLAISTQPSGAVSGVNLTTQPVVQIRDAANAVVTSSTASVTAAITSGTGTLVGTATVTAVNGVATFTNLRINGSGAHTISFTSTGLTAAASNPLTVTQVAASLGVQTQPAGATSGTAFTTQPVVQILDNAGLPVTSGTGATLLVTAARATGTGTLGGTLTATASNGVATFTDLEITGSGAHTLRFSTTSPALTTNSSSFTVTSVGATQLAISTQPSGAVSGVNLTTQPVVQIRDAANAVVTSSTASVTAAITSGTGTLVGTATVTAVNGVATFTNLRINGSGAHTISFTSTGLTAAASNPLTVTQVAASLGVQTQPAGATSGTAFTTQPVVQILDNAGLPVTSGIGATLLVTAARATGTGTLGGTLTATASNGVATFTDLEITGSGAHTLRFSTTSPALTTNSSSFTVTSNGATQLALTTQPAGAVSGVNLTTQPVVQIRDAANAVVSSSTAAVTASITTGNGTLVGTVTVNAVNGVATFPNLRINGSGAQTITFASAGLSSATANLTVTQVAAALAISTQPIGSTSGSPLATQPVVQVLDNAGLLVTTGSGATQSLTATLNSGTGTLGGTVTLTASGGVATFTTLAITGSGTFTLRFATTSPTLSVVSQTVTQP